MGSTVELLRVSRDAGLLHASFRAALCEFVRCLEWRSGLLGVASGAELAAPSDLAACLVLVFFSVVLLACWLPGCVSGSPTVARCLSALVLLASDFYFWL